MFRAARRRNRNGQNLKKILLGTKVDSDPWRSRKGPRAGLTICRKRKRNNSQGNHRYEPHSGLNRSRFRKASSRRPEGSSSNSPRASRASTVIHLQLSRRTEKRPVYEKKAGLGSAEFLGYILKDPEAFPSPRPISSKREKNEGKKAICLGPAGSSDCPQ